MWKCQTCGEQIDDQFDSCWKCTQVEPVPEPADTRNRERPRAGFWIAWRRGWLVLLMMLAHGVITGVVTLLLGRREVFFEIAGLVAFVFVLPPTAYWIFVLFFGQQAWPLPKGNQEIPREARAVALLDEATKLETRGRVKEALAKYQTVVDGFDGTTASRDAQKSIKSLRAKIG